jgi:pimeloyl-ACP methyl ester carboxylesterase
MTHRSRAATVSAALIAVLALLLSFAVSSSATSATTSTGASAVPSLQKAAAAGTHKGTKPTIVLVHGAFADSSGWSKVADKLSKRGYPVLAFSNPLRGPSYDSAYLKDFLSTVPGPIVLVGHSYGGVVITNAATGNANVKALVYIAAYAPDAGESVAAANLLGGGHPEVVDHLIVRPFPGAQPGDADAYIDPAWFPRLFAGDLPKSEARFLALSQRPGALAALFEPSGEPAWKTIPSYFLVAKQDRIIPPQAERAMAARAGSYTVEVSSSHVPMISRPWSVTKLILKAAQA